MPGIEHKLRDQSGQTLIFITVSIAVFSMFIGLAVDGGVAYFMRARLSNIADAAAFAGARGIAGSTNETEMLAQASAAACDSARLNGLAVDGPAGTCPATLTVEVGDMPLPSGGTQLGIVVNATGTRQTSFMRLGTFVGCGEICRTTNVGARAASIFAAVTGVELVPAAIRAPGFGAVDPLIPLRNPGKIGPSEPTNGEYFEIGEEIYLGAYGKGPKVGVTLVLDINLAGYQENYIQILMGHQPPVHIGVEETFVVIQEGRTNHTTKLDQRIADYPEGHPKRHIVVPVVDLMPDGSSRDPDGTLGGQVRIVDFVAVHLDGTVDVWLEDLDGNLEKSKHLVATIVKWPGTGVSGTRPPTDIVPETSVGVATLIQ